MNIIGIIISDLHLGEIHSERRLERLVYDINSLNPDIVAIAGDIFNDNFYAIRDPEGASALLGSINATFGVFASLGNHDIGPTLPSMLNFLDKSDIPLLKEEYVIINSQLVLVGRLDSLPPWMGDDGFGYKQRGDFANIVATIPQGLPVVVIDHNPANISEYGPEVDLALFGHTHGGGLFPINIATWLLFTNHRGHSRQDENSPHIIVTQGVHAWSIPMRVGTNNEIVKILIQ